MAELNIKDLLVGVEAIENSAATRQEQKELEGCLSALQKVKEQLSLLEKRLELCDQMEKGCGTQITEGFNRTEFAVYQENATTLIKNFGEEQTAASLKKQKHYHSLTEKMLTDANRAFTQLHEDWKMYVRSCFSPSMSEIERELPPDPINDDQKRRYTAICSKQSEFSDFPEQASECKKLNSIKEDLSKIREKFKRDQTPEVITFLEAVTSGAPLELLLTEEVISWLKGGDLMKYYKVIRRSDG